MFDGLKHHFTKAVNYVMQVISDSGLFKKQLKNSVIRAPRPINLSPIGYFDGAGAAQEGNCDIGGFLIILGKIIMNSPFTRGLGSNTRVEFLALWTLLSFAQTKNLSTTQILGDSTANIGWARGKNHLHVTLLQHWKRCINIFAGTFSGILYSAYISSFQLQSWFNV